jgi:hypothetical protein
LHICILYVGLCANIYKSTFVCFLLLSSVVPVFTHLLVAVPTLKALHQQRMPLFVLAVLHGRQRASVLDARAQMAPLGRRTHLFSRAFVLILVTDHDIEGQQHPNHHTCKRLAPLGLDTTPHTTMISVVWRCLHACSGDLETSHSHLDQPNLKVCQTKMFQPKCILREVK